jgi:heat shock protein HslJ
MLNRTSFTAASVLAAMTLAACTSAPQATTPATPSSVSLQSHEWQLHKALNAQGTVDPQWQMPGTPQGPAPTVGLRFVDAQTVSVENLCNRMDGRYTLKGTNIQFERLASTLMACPNANLMALERKVGQWLPQARTWKIVGNANAPVLELQFDNGARWQLTGSPTYERLYGASERIFLEVAPQQMACSHPLMPNAKCLQVREVTYDAQGIKQGHGAWEAFYGAIEGYTHQDGVRNVLRLKRYTRSPVPADASKYLYVLDMTVESERVR